MGISMVSFLGISYLLCRFAFYGMHGMKQWPNLLAIVGLIIIVVALLLGNRIISVVRQHIVGGVKSTLL